MHACPSFCKSCPLHPPPPGGRATPLTPKQWYPCTQAFSSAAAVPPPSGPISEDHPKALAEALAWRPQLGLAEDAVCLLAPAAACTGGSKALAGRQIGWIWGVEALPADCMAAQDWQAEMNEG